MSDQIRILLKLGLCSAVLCGAFFTTITHADTASDLQRQIDDSNAQIQKLRDEISQVQTELNQTSSQKKTLQSAVQELNLNIQKLTKNITLTETEIKQKDLEINKLSGNIEVTSGNIGISKTGVADSLRELASHDEEPMAVTLLAGGTLSSYFDEEVSLASLRNNLQNHIEDLSSLKANLEVSKDTAEVKRKELAGLKANLSNQKQGLAIARDSQTKLLNETKNKESTYQALLAQKKAQEEKFEQDLLNYEAQLKQIVDPGSFAGARAGVLSWPVDSPFITQYFGNTEFSTANPQIYNGKGHNAIDLRATDGTPIKAALSGTVEATGNTDLQAGCYSYGKWILIRHANGLSTLYAHLSVIGVQKGQEVSTGQLIGYSGRTGYATGPHLHFSVYASQGVEVVQFTRSVNCKNVSIPIADPSAYLNPLSYLPALR